MHCGSARNKNCRPTSGRVEVCSGSYGQNGWLGLAQIWLQSGSKHIVQGAVKVNDTYFSMPQYNYATQKQHVICQEAGHTARLDHQATSGASLNTCMAYYLNTSDSDTKSTYPNKHDYANWRSSTSTSTRPRRLALLLGTRCLTRLSGHRGSWHG